MCGMIRLTNPMMPLTETLAATKREVDTTATVLVLFTETPMLCASWSPKLRRSRSFPRIVKQRMAPTRTIAIKPTLIQDAEEKLPSIHR